MSYIPGRRFVITFDISILILLILPFIPAPVFADHPVPRTDVRVTVGSHQAEIAIAANPVDASNLIGGYMDLSPGRWRLGRADSQDGGVTWSTSLFGAPNSPFDSQADPVVVFNQAGDAFYVGITYDENKCFTADDCNSSLIIAKSTNKGRTWKAPVVFRQSGCGEITPEATPLTGPTWHDKPYAAIDTTGGVYDGRIYVSWVRFEGCPRISSRTIYFTYSADGGTTWSVDAALSGSGKVQIPSPAVGADGAVYVSWVEDTTSPMTIRVAKSTNGGQNFSTHVIAASGLTGSLGGIRPAIQALVADKQNANLVYLVYSDFPPESDGGDIRFTRSADGGSTWSTPITLNIGSTGNIGEQFFPAMSVTNGRIDIAWYDGRNFAQFRNFVDVFFTRSVDQGQSFSFNTKINDLSIPTEMDAGFIGHYIGVASTTDWSYPSWTGTVDITDNRDVVLDRITFPTHTGDPGGSPYLSTFDGNSWVLDNNLMPAAEHSNGQDVTDHYRIQQPLSAFKGKYALKISEFENAHNFVDQIRLLTIDHGSGYKIAASPSGEILTYSNPLPGRSATALNGADITSVLEKPDGVYYEQRLGDWLFIDFSNVAVTNSTKLLIRSDPAGCPPCQKSWFDVFVQASDGSWVDVADVFPRKFWYYDIVDISQYIPAGGNLGIVRIGFDNANSHRVDFVGLDTSPQQGMMVVESTLKAAIHSSLVDVTLKVRLDDGVYAEVVPGEYVLLVFEVPPSSVGTVRDFVFIIDGYYVSITV